MLILIDNYDSFTYNVFHYLSELNAKVKIFRNDETILNCELIEEYDENDLN